MQIDELLTEQEYSSNQSMIPGQGEDHRLRLARAKLKLDYSLRLPGNGNKEILGGRLSREARREPFMSTDDAETRALRDLTLDAARWLAGDLCDRRQRLLEKITSALPKPKPQPSSPSH